MAKARGIYQLYVALGVVGAASTLLVVGVVASSVTLHSPAGQSLLSACRSFVIRA